MNMNLKSTIARLNMLWNLGHLTGEEYKEKVKQAVEEATMKAKAA